MIINQFSVNVPEGREQSGGYVALKNGQQYTIRLRNFHDVPCDARVTVDGKELGVFRIWANNSITLERPLNDSGRLTFYRHDSKEGQNLGLDANDPSLGLVSVEFSPAKEQNQVYYRPLEPYTINPWHSWPPPTTWIRWNDYATDNTANVTYTSSVSTARASNVKSGLTAGGTGLSGKSGQEFATAPSIEYDLALRTTINLRLVASDNDDPRPLLAYSNPVPPPV